MRFNIQVTSYKCVVSAVSVVFSEGQFWWFVTHVLWCDSAHLIQGMDVFVTQLKLFKKINDTKMSERLIDSLEIKVFIYIKT